MIAKWILFIVIFCILVFGILFYGFVYSFRNFAGSDSWRPIKEYNFNKTKQVIEQSMYKIDTANPGILLQEDSSGSFKGYGWFNLSIFSPADTSQYFIKFIGDSLQWKQENSSEMRLFNISNKKYNISYTNLKNTDKKLIKKLLDDFENLFINPSRRLSNPEIND